MTNAIGTEGDGDYVATSAVKGAVDKAHDRAHAITSGDDHSGLTGDGDKVLYDNGVMAPIGSLVDVAFDDESGHTCVAGTEQADQFDHGNVVPGNLSGGQHIIQVDDSLADEWLVMGDDGEGNLVELGGTGNIHLVSGTIDYETGEFAFETDEAITEGKVLKWGYIYVGSLTPAVFNQAAEPTVAQLPAGQMCFWTDTDDSKCYLCYNHGGTVKTVEMT